MRYQEQLDGDKVFTGNVEILGKIENEGLSHIATEVQKSRTEAQSVKADFRNFWEAVLADKVVEPTEKNTLARSWAEIKTEYPIIRQRAIDIGMALDHAYIVAFESAYASLVTILEGTGGILVHMDQNSTVDPVAVGAAFENYQDSRETLVSGTIETARDDAVNTAGENVAERVPGYFGPIEYPGRPPEPWKKSDLYLSFSIMAGDAYRGMMRYSPSDGWVRTVDPSDLEKGIRDIVDICSILDAGGSPRYGTTEDYGVSSSKPLYSRLALIDFLKADEIEVRGTIRAERGFFKGQIDASPIKTEVAQVPGVITPPYSHWRGIQFITHLASLADGTHAATGTYDGFSVTSIKKGLSQTYQYDNSELPEDASLDWKTKKTFVATASGLVRISFQIKKGASSSTVHGRIVVNSVQIYSLSTSSSEYQTGSIDAILYAGDTVQFQAKSEYAFWPVLSKFILKDFKISLAANTVSIDLSGGLSRVVESSTYYSTTGAVTVAPLSEFNFAWMMGYYPGSALLALLQAAGGSVWQKIPFEPNKWSETYGMVVSNVFEGKVCNSYEIQDIRIVLFNDDGSTTSVYYSTMYAYSSSNKLYPTSRNARFYVGDYRAEVGNPVSILRLENGNVMEDNSKYSVISLNSPEKNHDPLAKFESTWAKTLKWYYDGIYHEFVSDDSYHNLVEENFSETLAHDATLKRFTRVSGNFHTFLDAVSEFKVSGYSGAYVGNNGIYRGLDVHTLWVGYTTYEGATPVTAPAMGGITLGQETFAASTTKISIDVSAKTITRSAGTFSNRLIGVGEYLFLFGFVSPYSANNGHYRIVEWSETVLKYDLMMEDTPVAASNIPGILVRYPVRHVHALLNFGTSDKEYHKPRVQWGYLKGSGAYEFGYEFCHATKRMWLDGGIKPAAKIHAETTSGALFTALNAKLIYVGEDMELHGVVRYTTSEYVPAQGGWVYTPHPITTSYAVKLSSTVIRIFGLEAGVLAQYDATSGSSDVIIVSISY